jgi:hypothetical protein
MNVKWVNATPVWLEGQGGKYLHLELGPLRVQGIINGQRTSIINVMGELSQSFDEVLDEQRLKSLMLLQMRNDAISINLALAVAEVK